MEFQQLLDYIKNASNSYDGPNGLVTKNVKTIHEEKDIALAVAEKNNGTSSLFILMRCSEKSSSWIYLCPTKNQIGLFNKLKPIYDTIDADNKANRIQLNHNGGK